MSEIYFKELDVYMELEYDAWDNPIFKTRFIRASDREMRFNFSDSTYWAASSLAIGEYYIIPLNKAPSLTMNISMPLFILFLVEILIISIQCQVRRNYSLSRFVSITDMFFFVNLKTSTDVYSIFSR